MFCALLLLFGFIFGFHRRQCGFVYHFYLKYLHVSVKVNAFLYPPTRGYSTILFNFPLIFLRQSPPSKRRKLEKPRKPLSFTLPEAGLKELLAKASDLGVTGCSTVDGISALLEKTLSDLRVSLRALLSQLQCKHQRLPVLFHLCDPAGATQTRSLQNAGAEPLLNSCGEHLDPRTPEET